MLIDLINLMGVCKHLNNVMILSLAIENLIWDETFKLILLYCMNDIIIIDYGIEVFKKILFDSNVT